MKRVIATEGQTVDIDFENGIVYVDGEALDEPYANTPTNLRGDFDGSVTVPEGAVFVLGDNRNESADNRLEKIGFVETRDIIGKAVWRIAAQAAGSGITQKNARPGAQPVPRNEVACQEGATMAPGDQGPARSDRNRVSEILGRKFLKQLL